MSPKAPPVAALLILGLLTHEPAAGQDSAPSQRPPTPRDFGVGNANILQIPASAFMPTSSKVDWASDANGYLYATSNTSGYNGVFWAPVQLPTGAVISYVDFYSYDNDATNDMLVDLNAYTGSVTTSY